MGKRRKAREFALQILYTVELNPSSSDEICENFLNDQKAEGDIKDFSRLIVKGTLEKKEEIDQMVKHLVKNWDIKRLGLIDRNIIRMGAYEMIFLSQSQSSLSSIPTAVTINEAVDIAKKYGTPDSGKFVNGILDEIRKQYCNQERP
jgi:transcription antitermination factor NusB